MNVNVSNNVSECIDSCDKMEDDDNLHSASNSKMNP